MGELATWAFLGTWTGVTAATLLIVQFVKPLSFMQKIDTRIIAYATALLLLLGVTVVTQGVWSDYFLALFNAVFVALAAMGGYEVTFKPFDEAKKKEG